MLREITPLILSYNEAPNIGRVLERLKWAKDIVVLDSFSVDGTLDIARRFPQVRVVQRQFDTFADQCNFGLEQIRTPWVLSLDADYVLHQRLVEEIGQLDSAEGCAGYQVKFRYCIQGQPLRSTLYPPRTVLYRRESARYRNDGHGHRVQIEGRVRILSGLIDHDDRKPLERWLHEQNRYALAEARHLLNTPSKQLNFPDRLRRQGFLAPALVFFYTLLAKGLILDGRPGWYYVFQRTYAEMLLSLRLMEARLGASTSRAFV